MLMSVCIEWVTPCLTVLHLLASVRVAVNTAAGVSVKPCLDCEGVITGDSHLDLRAAKFFRGFNHCEAYVKEEG